MKLCSVMVPTRKRVPRLLKTIESIRSTSKIENVEILLRTDTDDSETATACADHFCADPSIRILTGPRLKGYESLDTFYNELARISNAHWVLVLNDDITLEGNGWDEHLKRLPIENSLAWARYYRLNNSLYTLPGCAFVCPFVPTSTWLNHKAATNPVDVYWQRVARKKKWRIRPVNLTINHQRDNDTELALHRLISPCTNPVPG